MRILELEQTSVPDVEALASRVGLSAGYLSRQFTSVFGESPAAYGRRIRLNHAATRLLFNPPKLSEVARNFGFENQPAFNRAFRRQHGVSPGGFVTRVRDTGPVKQASGPEPVVHLVQRAAEPALARRFFGAEIGMHWRSFLSELPKQLGACRRRAGLIYDSPAVVPLDDQRYDCALPVTDRSELRRACAPATGLDAVELPGGYHAEIRGCSSQCIGAALRHLYSVWLPGQRSFVPEGDPMVHWWGETADGGVTVTIRLHEVIDLPAWNMMPLAPTGDAVGTR